MRVPGCEGEGLGGRGSCRAAGRVIPQPEAQAWAAGQRLLISTQSRGGRQAAERPERIRRGGWAAALADPGLFAKPVIGSRDIEPPFRTIGAFDAVKMSFLFLGERLPFELFAME